MGDPPSSDGHPDPACRRPLPWKTVEFYEEPRLLAELDRVFDVCQTCRRCAEVCQAFSTLFEARDRTPDGTLSGPAKAIVYPEVIDQCYLCDRCFAQCPYTPPRPEDVDFPHLMVRGKAFKAMKGEVGVRDKLLSATDRVGRLASIPGVTGPVNAAIKNPTVRAGMDKALGIHAEAWLPAYHTATLQRRLSGYRSALSPQPSARTRGKVALFATCYANDHEPGLGEDLVAVFEHNGIAVAFVDETRCCGMPRLEHGDLDGVGDGLEHNISRLATWVEEGWDLVAPVPSCVLMFKQKLPLLYPRHPVVARIRDAFYDPFQYLSLRHEAGLLNTAFKVALGPVVYHWPCHLRAQGPEEWTRDILSLVPGTSVETIKQCSGHNGTYAVKSEYYAVARRMAQPVCARVRQSGARHYGSDCPLAGHHIEAGLGNSQVPIHPLSLLRLAYGL